MITDRQRILAIDFKKMHTDKKFFVLPNAWNEGSAVILEKSGYKAIATSSAGIAFSMGCPDGQDIKLDDLCHCVERINSKINIPLSVDFERGYSESISGVKENAKRLLNLGAVGFNIEDGREDGTIDELEFMLTKIKALAELKKELNLHFVINARTCTYLLNIADEKTMLLTAIERGNSFLKAGADCVFVPGSLDCETVLKLTKNIDGPLNILLNKKFNDFKKLAEMGVVRLSAGSAMARYMWDSMLKMSCDFKEGNVKDMLEHDFTLAKANEFFKQ